MKKFIVMFTLLASFGAGAQIYGALPESIKPHSVNLPTRCVNGVEVPELTTVFKRELQNFGIYGGQIAVMVGNDLVSACGVGYSDPLILQKLNSLDFVRRADGISPSLIGSVSKFFVQVAIANAVNEGLIKWEDNIVTASGIKPYNGVVHSSFNDCTVLKTFQHTCLISRNFSDVLEIQKSTSWSLPIGEIQQLSYEVASLTRSTGDYSSIGYGLLGAALSRVYNKPLLEVIHEKVTDPIGIDRKEVQNALGTLQYCSDKKWLTRNGFQYCQNTSAVTLGREPGMLSPVSSQKTVSEYDRTQNVNATVVGAFENTSGAFSLVATPNAVLKMIANYNHQTGVRVDPNANLGASYGGRVTGGNVSVARSGNVSIYISLNMTVFSASVGDTAPYISNKLGDVRHLIDWGKYKSLQGSSPATVKMVTYREKNLDYYFAADPSDAAFLDTFPSWERLSGEGDSFTAFAPGAKQNVYRFLCNENCKGKATHFFGLHDDAKYITKYFPDDGSKLFEYEGVNFSVDAPENGQCKSGTPVYRLFRDASSGYPNHRWTTSLTVYNQEIGKGWAGEGVVFCAASVN